MASVLEIKELREKTGISIAQCKKSLEEAGGDMAKALELLKAKGAEIADKKAERVLRAGAVKAYIHSNGKLGALVQISAETDFVANNAEFKALAEDVAMHVAAMDPADNEELAGQPFVKDPSITITDLINSYVQKFGERIELVRFARFDTSA